MTNAVKHFKWEPRGKRRVHKTPAQREIDACRRWMLAEIEAIHPTLIVCLGATAAKAVFGPAFRVTRSRGQLLSTPLAAHALATWHPSAVLRAPNPRQREQSYGELLDDLRCARTALDAGAPT